ncbi:MAG: hypothetical protein ACKO9V_08780 [Candidatus Kapaibacterium sp.]
MPIFDPMNRRIFTLAIIALTCILAVSCGTGSREPVRPRVASERVVREWKSDLDSGHVPQAIARMAHPAGRRYVAVEAYEMRDEVSRWQRILRGAILSDMVVEIETDSTCRLLVEMDYHDMYLAQTLRVDSVWYLSSFRSRTIGD